ncbi:MAG: hypothetical protein LBB36_03670 [Fibromonadaceae bacterium]|jgi:hypothetical protein|nr:hypothetical protein [Fibromonadaceae bacterium]
MKANLSKITLAASLSLALAFTLSSCASKNPPLQEQAVAAPQPQYAGTDATDEIPCFEFDTAEYLAGLGEYMGSSAQFGLLVQNSTERAKQNILQKLGAHVQGLSTTFRSSYGSNQGSDVAEKMVSATDIAINKVISDARAICMKQGSIGADGHQRVFVGLRIYKEELEKSVVNTIADKLTDDEKRTIDFEEKRFREQHKAAFENFKEESK